MGYSIKIKRQKIVYQMVRVTLVMMMIMMMICFCSSKALALNKLRKLMN
jgi:hypothetical protein